MDGAQSPWEFRDFGFYGRPPRTDAEREADRQRAERDRAQREAHERERVEAQKRATDKKRAAWREKQIDPAVVGQRLHAAAKHAQSLSSALKSLGDTFMAMGEEPLPGVEHEGK